MFSNFKPTLWSDKIFQAYDKKFVFGNLANKSYEGQITKFGEAVKINEIGDVTVTAYSGSISYQSVSDASKSLLINQKYYAAVSVEDIDAAQTNPKLMLEIARKMGVSLSDNIDLALAGLYTEAGITSGSTGSPVSITSATVINELSKLEVLFDDNNVPNENRVMVVPPWFAAKCRLAKIAKDTNNSLAISQSSSYVGEMSGFQIFKSPNISHSTTTWYSPMAFVAGSTIAMASQIDKMEAGRREDEFADYLRSLILYGVKTVAPASLGVLYCAEGAEA